MNTDRHRHHTSHDHPADAHAEHAAAHQAHQHGPGAGEHTGHDKHAGHSVAMFRNKFWIALALTVPAMI